MLKAVMQALRAPFFTGTIVPVVIGAVQATRAGRFDITLFFLCLVGALSFHGAANVINDYFDYLGGTDNVNRYHNLFSGGSRVIQDGILTPKQTLTLGIILLCVGIAIGLYLVIRVGWMVLLFGVSGTILVLAYSIPRYGLAYVGRGLGELAVAVGFGPLMVLGTYWVMAGSLSATIWWLSLTPGLLIALILFVNGYPDYEADLKTAKCTAVVTLGRARARWVYVLILAALYLEIVLGVVLSIIPVLSLLALVTIPIAVAATRKLFIVYDDPRGVVPVCGMTIGLHLITGLSLALGVGMSSFMG
ncbi:MAG: prenyltransferase [Deltaproteobacteria bacterium]|nr:prenyltransferase [Candidatus Zymogenaceae bacterium]